MLKLNRKLEYALMALKVMVEKPAGELTTAAEVASGTGGAFDTVARVMQLMAQKEILHSEQGAHGGYVIVKDLRRLSFRELQEAVLGPSELVKCLSGAKNCDLSPTCNILSPVQILNRRLDDFYDELRVADLLRIKEPVQNGAVGTRSWS